MSKKKTSVATYFTHLELENFRCFEGKQELKLTVKNGELKQWTLILGDNGLGKTSLLQCLVWMRPVFITRPENFEQSEEDFEPFKKGILGAALEQEENDTIESLLRINGTDSFFITAKVCQGDNLFFNGIPSGKEICTRYEVFFNEKRRLREVNQREINIETDLEGKFWDPFIVAYGANRQMGIQNITDAELEDTLVVRLSKATELYDAEERLTTLDHAARDKEVKRLKRANSNKDSISREEKLLKTFKQALVEILPEEIKDIAKDEDDILIEPPKFDEGELRRSQVKLKTLNGPVPFSDLSLGYQTTMAWALDLAWRFYNRFPKSTKPLGEPAIVIIDEIDLHLHPRWQMEIMGKLSKLFPKTQFIATSHSPLMVQSMPNANFAIVHRKDNEICIINEPEKVKGWRVDQILNSEYFDMRTAWDHETEQLFTERDELLLKSKRTLKEENRLKEVENQIASLPTASNPEDRKAMELIRKAALLLEPKF